MNRMWFLKGSLGCWPPFQNYTGGLSGIPAIQKMSVGMSQKTMSRTIMTKIDCLIVRIF